MRKETMIMSRAEITNNLNLSREISANKSLSIKKASDIELSKILTRLYTERDVQRIIKEIRNLSTPTELREYLDVSVSTDLPINELYHFGIKGMHWGQRRSARAASSTSATGVKKNAKAKNLSDEQLQKAVRRLNLEKSYTALTKEKKSPIKKFVSETLGAALKSTVKVYAKEGAKYGGDKVKVAIAKKLIEAKAKKG